MNARSSRSHTIFRMVVIDVKLYRHDFCDGIYFCSKAMHVTCQVIESKGKDANSSDSNISLPRDLLVDFIRCSLAEAAEIRDRGAA